MLKGKVAIITGAGSGIGREIAMNMARCHATIIVADMNLTLAEETAENIKMICGIAYPLKCNITSYEEVDELVKETIRLCNNVDILVNNAGIFKESDFSDTSNKTWDMHIAVNLTGTYNCIKAVTNNMAMNYKGSIINIATVDAFQGCKGFVPYCASKAGVIGLTKDAALELSEYGIRVNAIAPGIIETNMTKDRIEKNKEVYLEKIPLKRIGKPKDIANAAIFLASDMSDYITGHTLHVNGGMRFD